MLEYYLQDPSYMEVHFAQLDGSNHAWIVEAGVTFFFLQVTVPRHLIKQSGWHLAHWFSISVTRHMYMMWLYHVNCSSGGVREWHFYQQDANTFVFAYSQNSDKRLMCLMWDYCGTAQSMSVHCCKKLLQYIFEVLLSLLNVVLSFGNHMASEVQKEFFCMIALQTFIDVAS